MADVIHAVRTFQNAQDAFDDHACAVLGINRSDGRCIDILDHSGPLTAGELARRADLSTAAITALVDRLERSGFVTRVRDTVDRRRVLIAVTDASRSRCHEIWGPMAAQGETMLESFSDAELETVVRFLRGGEGLMSEHLERIRKAFGDGPSASAGKIPA